MGNILVFPRNGVMFVTNCTNLSLAENHDRPHSHGRVLHGDPRVDGGAEDVVEVVDDASNEAPGADGDQNDPEDLPKRARRQRNVVEPVRGGPEIEPCE